MQSMRAISVERQLDIELDAEFLAGRTDKHADIEDVT